MVEPRSHHTPKELVAERMNDNEGKRLILQTRFFLRQKRNAEHIMDQKINRVRETLDHITLSSGNVSSEEFLWEEVSAPCFMYGERVESRRRYSKRMALLRYFLEHRPKSPQGLGKKSFPSSSKIDIDMRSADEIFQEILNKIEPDSDSEEDEESDTITSVPPNVKRIQLRRASTMSEGETTATRQLLFKRDRIRRPNTAPCSQSKKQSSALGDSCTWATSSSSVYDLSSLSPRIRFLLEDDAMSASASSSQQDVYVPYWADMDPVTSNELRSSRIKTRRMSNVASLQQSTNMSASSSGGKASAREALRNPSTSSLTSVFSNSSSRTVSKPGPFQRKPSMSSLRTRHSEQPPQRVDAFFARPKPASTSSQRTNYTEHFPNVDSVASSHPKSASSSRPKSSSSIHPKSSSSSSNPKASSSFTSKPSSSSSSNKTQHQDEQNLTVDAFFASADGVDYQDVVLESLSSGDRSFVHPFRRTTIYAPTIASRQRTISSMLVTAGKKKKSVTAV